MNITDWHESEGHYVVYDKFEKEYVLKKKKAIIRWFKFKKKIYEVWLYFLIKYQSSQLI